jgi:hypothetical protein
MIALQSRGAKMLDPTAQTAKFVNMMNMTKQQEAAQRQASLAQQSMDINQAKEGREKELQPFAVTKASSEAGSAKVKYVMDFLETSEIALANARDGRQATALGDRIKQMFPEPELQQSIDATLSSIPQDPGQFEDWRKDSLMRTMDAKEQLAQEFQKQTTGTEERVIAIPKFGGGAATEVPGSRIQVAQGMQYITDDAGNVRAVPKETGGGFAASAPSMGAPGAGGDTFDIMINMESRGNQFTKSGAPLTSPKGAIGIAQIMPGTAPEAAKLAGLPYDKARLRTDRDYNLALGRAYFEKQLADFGDPRLAAAAYNAGPGAVRRALAKGGPNGWINNVPRETQNYVASIPGGDGGAPIVVKGTGGKTKTTEDERKIGSNVSNMVSAAKEMAQIVLQDPSAIAPSGTEYAAGQVPFYGDEAARFAQSGPRQRFNAALEKILSAVTFINTGAGVSKEQMDGYRRSYFPTYQDTERTRQSKLLGVLQYIRDSKVRAGAAWTPELDGALTGLQKIFGSAKTYGSKSKPATPTKSSDGWGSAKQVGN